MPDRIKLSSDDDVEVFVQRTIKGPVFHLKARIRLLELTDADFDALQDSVLDLPHSICHGYLQLDHLSFLAALQRFRDSDLEAWPERRLANEKISHHVGQGCEAGHEGLRRIREGFQKANFVVLAIYPDDESLNRRCDNLLGMQYDESSHGLWI